MRRGSHSEEYRDTWEERIKRLVRSPDPVLMACQVFIHGSFGGERKAPCDPAIGATREHRFIKAVSKVTRDQGIYSWFFEPILISEPTLINSYNLIDDEGYHILRVFPDMFHRSFNGLLTRDLDTHDTLNLVINLDTPQFAELQKRWESPHV